MTQLETKQELLLLEQLSPISRELDYIFAFDFFTKCLENHWSADRMNKM
jgi:hypothetical protein